MRMTKMTLKIENPRVDLVCGGISSRKLEIVLENVYTSSRLTDYSYQFDPMADNKNQLCSRVSYRNTKLIL